MVLPDVAIITNIGWTHIENLGSKENIFKAKSEILETLNNNQLALLNGDDEYLSRIKDDKFPVAFVGVYKEELDLKVEDFTLEGDSIKFVTGKGHKGLEEYRLNLPEFIIYNSLFAIYLGKFMDYAIGNPIS